MGTLIEEIFSHKLGRTVTQEETVIVEVDHVMSHDTTSPLAIQAFRKLAPQTGGRVFNSQRSHIVFDHIIPAARVAAATLYSHLRTRAGHYHLAGRYLSSGDARTGLRGSRRHYCGRR